MTIGATREVPRLRAGVERHHSRRTMCFGEPRLSLKELQDKQRCVNVAYRRNFGPSAWTCVKFNVGSILGPSLTECINGQDVKFERTELQAYDLVLGSLCF